MPSDLNFDIATVVAAVVAALAALFSAYVAKKDNAKKDMLENLTAERISDVHNIRKYTSLILSEASLALNTQISNEDEHIANVLGAANELWFIFKPVYEVDREVLYSLKTLVNALLSFYHHDFEGSEQAQKALIEQSAVDFRKKAFLYAHSDWTCVKNQILQGERSSYTDFNEIHKKNSKTVAELDQKGAFAEPNKNIWFL